MRKKIVGIVVLAFFVFIGIVPVMAADSSIYRADSMDVTKKFSETALENLKSNSGSNVEEAERVYKDLAHNEILTKAADKIYRDLDAHQAFAATLAEHIMKGGASFTQTQVIMSKLAAAYGKALAEIINGSTASAAYVGFMAELRDLLQPHYLKPKEYSLAVKCAEAYLGTLRKILGR